MFRTLFNKLRAGWRRFWRVATYFTKARRVERARARQLERERKEISDLAADVGTCVRSLIEKMEEQRAPRVAPADTAILVAEGPPATRADAALVREESRVAFSYPDRQQAAKALTKHNDKFTQRRKERPDWNQE